MSAPRPPSSLLAKLTELLGSEPSPEPAADASAAAPPEDALSDAIREELQKAQKVVTLLTKQALALDDRFALLRAACEAGRVLPPTGAPTPAGHAPQLPALVALLRADQEAARLVASAVLRFADLRADIQELTGALQRGESKPERLEAIKGKHAFLPRVHLYFQGVPLLAALFRPAAPPPGFPAATPVVPGSGSTTGTLSLSGGAGARSGLGLGGPPRATGPLPPPAQRPTTPIPRPPAARTDQLQLTRRPPPRAAGEEAPLTARGPVLLRALEVKIAILQGAWALAQIPPLDGPKLPAVLAPTVKAAAAVLAGNAALRDEAKEAIDAFHRAKALLMPGARGVGSGAAGGADLPRLLTLLGTLPARFRDVPAIGPLFT